MIGGFVPARKSPGMGSSELVGKLKHTLKERVGHTGTLDRFASGLMILVVGRATSLSDFFLHADKRYVAVFRFGKSTESHDPEGPIIEKVNTYGASNRPDSPHYDDQMEMFLQHKTKRMSLNKKEVYAKAERVYHPQ